MEVTCPKCGKKLRGPNGSEDREARCKGCGEVFVVGGEPLPLPDEPERPVWAWHSGVFSTPFEAAKCSLVVFSVFLAVMPILANSLILHAHVWIGWAILAAMVAMISQREERHASRSEQ
jgi:hypothetical protein